MARALWPRVAADLGFAVAGSALRRLRSNSRHEARRCVLEVTLATGQRYVLRVDLGEENPQRWRGVLDRHKAAAEVLAPIQGHSVPAILWEDPRRRFVLMEHAPGETAFRELEYADFGLGDRGALMHRIGSAVGLLHRTSTVGEATFLPAQHLGEVRRWATSLRAGEVQLDNPNRFLGLCAMLHRAGQRARGSSYTAALEHGDLHMRNILVSADQITLIDFSNPSGTIPQRDLANLWLANGLDHVAREGEATGFGLIARSDLAAFEAGYGSAISRDPVFRFFYLHRLFRSWQSTSQGEDEPGALARRKELARKLVAIFEDLRARENA